MSGPLDVADADLSGSSFRMVDLSGTTFRSVDLRGARVIDAVVDGLEIDGDADHLVVNGVDVMPLVEAELDRRHPERPLMRPTSADGYRTAWAALERLWASTVERARALPAERLHERVDDEWSFIETLRHLVFATDAWVGRAYLGDPSPWSPLGLPHSEMPAIPGVPRDLDARPSLDEVLADRAERVATVRRVFADLTDERLAGATTPVPEPGYPESEAFAVSRALGAIVREEWAHRLYAERDLDVLASR